MAGDSASCGLSLPRVEKAVSFASRSVGRYGGVVLQAAAAWNQSLLFAAAAGALDTGATNISLRDSFEVASVTKAVTATAVLQLADEGLLDLDEALGRVAEGRVLSLVQEHVPKWSAHRLGNITIVQLLQHTSGSLSNCATASWSARQGLRGDSRTSPTPHCVAQVVCQTTGRVPLSSLLKRTPTSTGQRGSSSAMRRT